jgi:2'-5' RNA ligase
MSMEDQANGKTSAYGVVTLIEGEPREWIEGLWRELLGRFNLQHPYESPIAHFSYHVASGYDMERVKPLLAQFAQYKQGFKVRTEGLGVFTKKDPIIHIPLVRNPQLTTFQRSLWQVIDSWSENPLAYYHPDSWMPHITLVHGNLPSSKLPEIVGFLASKQFNWELEVSNISIICSSRPKIDPELSFNLSPETLTT